MFNIRGLKNSTGTNCYADTVLLSMFLYKKSPFYRILDDSWESDKEIQTSLKNVVNNFDHNCTDFIKIVDEYYNSKNKRSRNLLNEMNDVSEFYDRIVNF